jgi:O-antigen/teichoic acid export membrane protein
LQWAVVAIGFSSVKRPFVSGLIALFQEQLVCRVNVTAALIGLLLVPLCIRYWGIWGPVMAWIVLEGAACLALVLLFHYLSSQSRPSLVMKDCGEMNSHPK